MSAVSTLAIIGTLVALVAFALAGVLYVDGTDAEQRLGMLFALIGTVTAALIAMLRADQAHTNANGTMRALAEQNAALAAELAARKARP